MTYSESRLGVALRRFRASLDPSAEKKFLFAQFLDAVAEARGFFKLKLFGCFAHLGIEFSDIEVKFRLRGELRQAYIRFLFNVSVELMMDWGVMPFSSLYAR